MIALLALFEKFFLHGGLLDILRAWEVSGSDRIAGLIIRLPWSIPSFPSPSKKFDIFPISLHGLGKIGLKWQSSGGNKEWIVDRWRNFRWRH